MSARELNCSAKTGGGFVFGGWAQPLCPLWATALAVKIRVAAAIIIMIVFCHFY